METETGRLQKPLPSHHLPHQLQVDRDCTEAAVYKICAGGFCERARRACVLSEAKERHQSQTISAKFARSRLAVGALLDWLPFQIIVGVILVVNCALEVYKMQAQDILFDYLGHPTQIAAIKFGKFRLSFLGNLLIRIFAKSLRSLDERFFI